MRKHQWRQSSSCPIPNCHPRTVQSQGIGGGGKLLRVQKQGCCVGPSSPSSPAPSVAPSVSRKPAAGRPRWQRLMGWPQLPFPIQMGWGPSKGGAEGSCRSFWRRRRFSGSDGGWRALLGVEGAWRAVGGRFCRISRAPVNVCGKQQIDL